MRGLPPGTIMAIADRAATEEEEEHFVLPPSLTYGQRAAGALICYIGSYLLSLGSTFRWAKLLAGGDPASFAFVWTVGNAMYLCSICFLLGPKYRLRSVFHEPLLAWYVSSAALTLAFSISSSGVNRSRGIGGRRVAFVVLSLCQVLSAACIVLSHVPYWRGATTKLMYIGRMYYNFCSNEEF